MTLSRFLRDFLYIPLGGNRGGPVKTYRNLMITMVLGGLWHGAAWTFVLWGGFHGAGLVVEHAVRGRGPDCPPSWRGLLPSCSSAWRGSRSARRTSHGLRLRAARHARAVDAAQPRRCRRCARHLALQLLPERPLDAVRERLQALNPVVLGAGLAIVVALVAATVPGNAVPPFIYFRF